MNYYAASLRLPRAFPAASCAWTASPLRRPFPGVTDREYYTNGFHVPVYYDISRVR